MNTREWIQALKKRHPRKSAAGLGRALGRDPSVGSKILGGARSVRADEIPAIASYYGEAPPPELTFVNEPASPPQPDHLPLYSGNLSDGMMEIDGADWVSVGRYDARLSAGSGSLLDGDPEPLGYALFEAQWLQEITRAAPQHLALVRVDGDSMENTLHDGDWVMVDRSQHRFGREGIYALRVGETAWIKRLSLNLRERLIRVLSDNPAYPPQEMDEEDLALIGRVVWIVGRKV